MFFLLFIIAFIIGISTAFEKKFLFYFFVLVLVAPTGAAFDEFIYKSGLFFFDGFFLGAIVSFIILFLRHKKLYMSFAAFILFSSLVVFYMIYIITSYDNVNVQLKYFFKDMRPLIYVIEMYILYVLARNFNYEINLDRLAVYAAMSNLVYLFVTLTGTYISSDVYYQNNDFRYLDASTYFIAIYLIYNLTKTQIHSIWNLPILLSILSLMASNSRFLLFSLVVTIIVFSIKSIKKLFRYTLFIILIGIIFLGYSQYAGSERVLSSISSTSVLFEQLANRFHPAVLKIVEMQDEELLRGLGLGVTFEIPWFNYREIENENISIDSLYLTFFVKMGLLSFVFLGALYALIIKTTNYHATKNKYVFFMLLMGIVSAYLYQSYFMGFMIAMYTIFIYDNSMARKIHI